MKMWQDREGTDNGKPAVSLGVILGHRLDVDKKLFRDLSKG